MNPEVEITVAEEAEASLFAEILGFATTIHPEGAHRAWRLIFRSLPDVERFERSQALSVFARTLASGKNPPDDPRTALYAFTTDFGCLYACRERLANLGREERALHAHLLVRCWNALAEQKPMRHVLWQKDFDPQPPVVARIPAELTVLNQKHPLDDGD